MTTRVWQIRALRFGKFYRKQIERAKNILVLLNANAVEIETNPEGSAVERVKVACLGWKAIRRASKGIRACDGRNREREITPCLQSSVAGWPR